MIAPTRRVRTTNNTKGAPWYTQELRGEKQALRQSERLWRNCPNSESKNVYKEKLALYKASIIRVKSIYYEARIREATDTQKETFKVLRELSCLIVKDRYQSG